MRISPVSLLCVSLVLAACNSASAANPLIGTWTSTDNPVPAGCNSKVVFTEKTMYTETPAVPNLSAARKGTVNIMFGGDPKQQKVIVVMNPATSMMDDWVLSDAKHATSGAIAQCHYVKQ